MGTMVCRGVTRRVYWRNSHISPLLFALDMTYCYRTLITRIFYMAYICLPLCTDLSYLFPASLQFIPDRLATQVWHSHNLDNQTSPTSKVLCPLALARLRIVLLPRETCLLPTLVNSVDEVLAEVGV